MSTIIIILCGVFFVSANGIWARCDEYKNSIKEYKENALGELQTILDDKLESCRTEMIAAYNNMNQTFEENILKAQQKLEPLRGTNADPAGECNQKVSQFTGAIRNVAKALERDCFQVADPISSTEFKELLKIGSDLENRLNEFNAELEGKKCWQQRLLIAHAKVVVLTAKIRFEGAADATKNSCRKGTTNISSCVSKHNGMKDFRQNALLSLDGITTCVQDKIRNAGSSPSGSSSSGSASSGSSSSTTTPSSISSGGSPPSGSSSSTTTPSSISSGGSPPSGSSSNTTTPNSISSGGSPPSGSSSSTTTPSSISSGGSPPSGSSSSTTTPSSISSGGSPPSGSSSSTTTPSSISSGDVSGLDISPPNLPLNSK